SALFVNDVVCVVLTPVVLEATRQLRLAPVPYLLALATAANVGSVATLTGNPQNMLVGSFSGISYRAFLAYEAPVAIVGLACVFAVVALVYRRELLHAPLEMVPDARLAVHYPLMWKTISAVAVMLVAFLAGVPIAIVAVAGSAYAADAAGEAREGLPRGQLGAAGPLRWPLRRHRRPRALGHDRSLAALGRSGEPAPPGRAHRGRRGAFERRVERPGGPAVQAGARLVRRA